MGPGEHFIQIQMDSDTVSDLLSSLDNKVRANRAELCDLLRPSKCSLKLN